MRFVWVKMNAYNLVRKSPKFTQFFSFNAELTVFDLVLKYTRGTCNSVADCMSRVDMD